MRGPGLPVCVCVRVTMIKYENALVKHYVDEVLIKMYGQIAYRSSAPIPTPAKQLIV